MTSGETVWTATIAPCSLTSASTRLVATGENTKSIGHRAVLAEKEMIAHDI